VKPVSRSSSSKPSHDNLPLPARHRSERRPGTEQARKRGTILQAHTAVGNTRFTVGPVDSLVAYPSRIRVTEGGSFELKNLYVVAIDSKGKTVPRAPLELELKAFNCTLGTERIMGFRRGTATMRITSLLTRHDKETKTAVEIAVQVTLAELID